MISKSISERRIIAVSASFEARFVSSLVRLVLIGMGSEPRFLVKGYLLLEQQELEGFSELLVRSRVLEINPLLFTAWRLLFDFSFTSCAFFVFFQK